MARIIVVTSGKGGVGKSSISLNIAIALSKEAKVCLIDADFGLKNLDVMMGLENRVVYDLKDVVEGRCSLDQVLIKDKKEASLFLLPACKSLKFDDFKTDYMNEVIRYFDPQFDYIIIDSPAGIEKGFECACLCATEAIVVATLDMSSIRDCDRVIGLLMKKNISKIGLIINRYNPAYIQNKTSLSLNEALDILALPLLGIVYDDESMMASNNKGMSNLDSELVGCFHRIVERINGKSVPYKLKKKKTKNFFFWG